MTYFLWLESVLWLQGAQFFKQTLKYWTYKPRRNSTLTGQLSQTNLQDKDWSSSNNQTDQIWDQKTTCMGNRHTHRNIYSLIITYGNNIIQWINIKLYYVGLITDKPYSMVANQTNYMRIFCASFWDRTSHHTLNNHVAGENHSQSREQSHQQSKKVTRRMLFHSRCCCCCHCCFPSTSKKMWWCLCWMAINVFIVFFLVSWKSSVAILNRHLFVSGSVNIWRE